MKQKNLLAGLLLLCSAPAAAHEGHVQDLSDEEIAELATSEQSAGHGGDAHSTPEGGNHSEGLNIGSVAASPVLRSDEVLGEAIRQNRVSSVSDFLGRLHPVAAHFPIGLLLAAALAELLMIWRPALALNTTIKFLVAGGAIGAVTSALFGWFAAGWRLSDRSETLALHRWNGTGIAALSLLAVWVMFQNKSRSGLRLILFALAVSLAIQGYLGGEMVSGPNHLGIR